MPDHNQIPEPEVVKAVQEEIRKLGDGIKADRENYASLRTGFEELKAAVEKSDKHYDTLIVAQIKKWGEDITTRQNAIDAKAQEASVKLDADKKALMDRIDAMEVAMKRSPKAGAVDGESQEAKDARRFIIATMAVSQKFENGANWESVDRLQVNMDEFRAYTKAFEGLLRRNSQAPVPLEESKALSVGIDPDGGYTVTPVMSNTIIKRGFEKDPMRALASVETISTGAIEWLVDYSEAGGGWEGETESGDETDTPKIFKKRIPVHVLYAKPRATQTLLEDSGINIESWLAEKQADRFLRIEAPAFVSGNGVGKPRGFLTYSDYATAGVDEWGKVEQVSIGNPVTADGLIDLKFSLIEQYLQSGTWLMNRLTVADVMQLKDGAGRYIWSPGLKEAEYSTLLGLPLRMSTTMPVQAANALSVAIADWRMAYMIVDRLGITVQRDPFTQKPYVEFYTRKRVGGDVINFQALKLGIVA